MDLLAQHEAFLRAIFDAPDDDTPRLVYADFLEENGAEDRARFIRWQCGHGERPARTPPDETGHTRGFRPAQKTITVSLARVQDPDGFRRFAVQHCPECFGVVGLKVCDGRITSAEPLDSLFGLAAFARVAELNLEGGLTEFEDADYPQLLTYQIEPVITAAGVEALARCRWARRLSALDLRNNNLDNDAARALVASPYLANLKRLQLLEGNRLRGKVWQLVIERFGEDVVG